MRIGIDARVLDRKITGTGRFLLNVLKELPACDPANEYFVFTSADLPVDKNFFKIITTEKSWLPTKLYAPFWLNFVLPGLVKKYKIDILLAANILLPAVNMGSTKCVSVIHDAMPKIFPEYYPFFYRKYLDFFIPPTIRKSDRVITVSELSKNEIHKHFGVPLEKIRVAYNTASESLNCRKYSDEEEIIFRKKLSLPDKYILYVGVVETRKNILGLLKIFDLVKSSGSNLQLVVVGKPGFGSGKIMPEFESRKDSVKYFRFLDDAELEFVYNKAFVFVFPSYYEGFGIPPLEAMKTGIPVMVSDIPALREVVGDAGMRFDPEDHLSFAENILKLETNEEFYNRMKDLSFAGSKKFRIADTAMAVVNTINELTVPDNKTRN